MHRIIVLILLTSLPLTLFANKVSEYHLDNGMQVLVKPDHRAPVVVSQVWYKVGASDEHSGITGLSHVLEHMMFKGTEKYPSGRFSAIISENGGRENAFTGRDYTAYYQYVGKDRLEIAMQLEADRMRNLTLPEDEFSKEVNVVKEERLMRTEDNPEALTYERFNAAAYLNSPYQNPVIGWMTDLDNLEIGDLKDWYEKYYQPANATLVVVGDVEPDEVYKLAKKYYGVHKSQDKLPVTKPRKEVSPKGLRRIQVKVPAKVPYVLMGYQVPVLNNAEEPWIPYALDVLSGILDGSSSARLTKELVRGQEIASAIGAGYSLSEKYGGQFLIEANPGQGHTIAEVEQAIEVELEKLRNELVSQDELERIKTQVIADDIYALDSVRHQANQIGMLETVGVGYEMLDEYSDKISQVTAEQVREVAKKYLQDDRKTVAELVPLPLSEKTPRQATAVHHR